jgi:hypothetical protein
MPNRSPTRPAPRRLATLAFCLASALLWHLNPADAATRNAAPKIWGKPPTTAVQGARYAFVPGASDANRDRLTFSIVNKPRWMWFNTRTGSLSGVPRWAQRNRTFSNIVIKVSDGKATVSLPAFSIRVVSGTSGGNHAPTISGTPPSTARVGQPYAFKPAAKDADGDRLTFSVAGKPGWAKFDTTNGALWGTPTSANVGKYGNIVIKVTDGKASASLSPFTLTVTTGTSNSVTLNWSSPTQNTDGTPLTNLAGYRVFYGQASRRYSKTVSLPAGARSVVVDGLSAGTWYFAIKSINTSGVLSGYSGEVRVVL